MGLYSFTIIAYILSANCKKGHVMIHCICLPVNVSLSSKILALLEEKKN